MKIVVVGASGNIGTGLLRRLEAEPDVTEIVGVATRLPSSDVHPYSLARWHAIDVGADNAPRRLAEVFQGADVVVHLAWRLQPNRDEKLMWLTNVRGLDNTLAAVAAASVPQVIVASSVGAYSVGPKKSRVDENWPTGGIPSSHYSRHKAMNERSLDAFEAAHPSIVVTRVRPGLVMHAAAGAQIRRLFLASWLPLGWLKHRVVPVIPFPSRVKSQVIHVDDLADLMVRAASRRIGGAFNAATEPVLDADAVAETLHGRPILMRTGVVRTFLAVAWRLRIVAMDPGWIDIASTVPIMSTDRARTLLGWAPKVDARAALAELIEALASDDAYEGSPPLDPHTSQPKR